MHCDEGDFDRPVLGEQKIRSMYKPRKCEVLWYSVMLAVCDNFQVVFFVRSSTILQRGCMAERNQSWPID